MTDNENKTGGRELRPRCFTCRHRDIRETSDEWLENFCRHPAATDRRRGGCDPFGSCENYAFGG